MAYITAKQNTYKLGLWSKCHGDTSIVVHAMEEVALANLTYKLGGRGRERESCHEMVGDGGEECVRWTHPAVPLMIGLHFDAYASWPVQKITYTMLIQ